MVKNIMYSFVLELKPVLDDFYLQWIHIQWWKISFDMKLLLEKELNKMEDY